MDVNIRTFANEVRKLVKNIRLNCSWHLKSTGLRAGEEMDSATLRRNIISHTGDFIQWEKPGEKKLSWRLNWIFILFSSHLVMQTTCLQYIYRSIYTIHKTQRNIQQLTNCHKNRIFPTIYSEIILISYNTYL